ncbi:MAG: response regulator transcription factor [Saprospiraceae bacterium]|nr:response regulator transcription factor [Saprospiraceae bacterium]
MGVIALVFTVLGIWLSKKISPENTSFLQISNRVEGDASGILSERELEVLKHIADGKSNQEIAASLYISIHTVKTHTTNIFEKLQVRRRTQAVLRARELGLIKELITGTNLKK